MALLRSGLVGNPVRKKRLDARAQLPMNAMNDAHGLSIGDPSWTVKPAGFVRQRGVQLRAGSVYDDDANPQHRQQRQIVHDRFQISVRQRVTAKQHDKGLAAVRADIRRGLAKPVCVVVQGWLCSSSGRQSLAYFDALSAGWLFLLANWGGRTWAAKIPAARNQLHVSSVLQRFVAWRSAR